MPKIICIVQARMGSSRLPGKVLMDLSGRPLLAHVIERLKNCRSLSDLVIATTDQDKDLPVVRLANEIGVNYFCGDESDVLSRYWGAAQKYGADVIVRVTSDCPLIDPVTVDNAVNYYLYNDFDYVAAGVGSGFPRGLDTEVFSLEALKRAFIESTDKPSREHVTYYLYQHPELFKIGYYQAPPEIRHPEWRLCVDEEADYKLIRGIYQKLYESGLIIDILTVIDLLNEEPELASVNSYVKQKVI